MSFGEVQITTMPSTDTGDGYKYVKAAEDMLNKAGSIIHNSGTIFQRVVYSMRDSILGPPTPAMKHKRFCTYLEQSSKAFGNATSHLERRVAIIEYSYDLHRKRHLELVKDTGEKRKQIISLEQQIETCRQGEKQYSRETIGTIDFTTISLAKLEGTRDYSIAQGSFDLCTACEIQERDFLTILNNYIATTRSLLDYAKISRRRVDDLRNYAEIISPTYEAIKCLGNEFQRVEFHLEEVRKSLGIAIESARTSSGTRKLEDKKIPVWDSGAV